MDNLLNLKEFAKIGKTTFIKLAGIMDNHKRVEYIETIDYTLCKNCPIYEKYSNTPDEFDTSYCDCCQRKFVKVPKTTYYNEQNRYKLFKYGKRLSKLQVKQLLLYHFLNPDRHGIIKNISIKEIAKILNCSPKTIKNNNLLFVDMKFILLAHGTGNDVLTIKIVGYEDYHLPKSEGGTGYINLSVNTFHELLKIDDVNSLRLEIRKIQKDTTKGMFTYQEAKRFLPGYFYKKSIKKIATKHTSAFETIVKEDCIEYQLLDDYNGNVLKEKKQKEYQEYISNNLLNKLKQLPNTRENRSAITDLIQLSFEYSLSSVENAINLILNNYDKSTIFNIGGFVRRYINIPTNQITA